MFTGAMLEIVRFPQCIYSVDTLGLYREKPRASFGAWRHPAEIFIGQFICKRHCIRKKAVNFKSQTLRAKRESKMSRILGKKRAC